MEKAFGIKKNKRVRKDLEEIFDYSLDQFGLEQAEKYVSAFDDYFEKIRQNPSKGQRQNTVAKELWRYRKERHFIFYRIYKTHVRIVRILHDQMDFGRHF